MGSKCSCFSQNNGLSDKPTDGAQKDDTTTNSKMNKETTATQTAHTKHTNPKNVINNASHNKKHKRNMKDISKLVPPSNHIPHIKTKLRFIKSLGTGASCKVVLATYRDSPATSTPNHGYTSNSYSDHENCNSNSNSNMPATRPQLQQHVPSNTQTHTYTSPRQSINTNAPHGLHLISETAVAGVENINDNNNNLKVNHLQLKSSTASPLANENENENGNANGNTYTWKTDGVKSPPTGDSNVSLNGWNLQINIDSSAIDSDYNSDRDHDTDRDSPTFSYQQNCKQNLNVQRGHAYGHSYSQSGTFSFLDNIEDERFALKIMKKKYKMTKKMFYNEAKILTKLKENINPLSCNVASLITCYIDHKNYYIATKYCEGGALLDFIQTCKYFNEQQASYYIGEILRIVEFIHNLNIAHRDLKPGNIMFDIIPILNENFDGTEENGDLFINGAKLILIDFGEAIAITNDETEYTDIAGTPVYLPPEVCKLISFDADGNITQADAVNDTNNKNNNSNNHKSKSLKGWQLKMGDIWAVGVIAYILMVGCAPFAGRSTKETMKKIECDQLKWENRYTHDYDEHDDTYRRGMKIEVSSRGRDFVNKLMTKLAQNRMTAKEALTHEWIVDNKNNLNQRLISGDLETKQLLQSVGNFHDAGLLTSLFLCAFVLDLLFVVCLLWFLLAVCIYFGLCCPFFSIFNFLSLSAIV